MTTSPPQPFLHKDAGVDIDAGDALVNNRRWPKPQRDGVLAGIGGFWRLV
jgi:hypothetical protein